MTNEILLQRAKRPKGIILLVLIFYGAAALVVISALATGGTTVVPSDMAAIITIYLIILAWGLWRMYRWAWLATLIMFALSTFYVLSNAALLGESGEITYVQIVSPLLFIGVWLWYLIQPKVRHVYMGNGWIENQNSEIKNQNDE